MGIYLEETITASVTNSISVSSNIAKYMAKEFWIYDPDNHSSYTNGVVKLYNEDTPADIYGNISGVSGKTISVSSGIGIGDDITVGYFAAGTGTGTTDQAPRPGLTWTQSSVLYPQSIMSHTNALDLKSPKNLQQLGYKYADRLAFKRLAGSDIDTSFDQVFALSYSSPDTGNDYHADADFFYPFVIEEVRVLTDDDDIDFRVNITSGSRTTDGGTYLFGEGGNDYIDLSASSCTYATNDASNLICSIPIGGVVATEVIISMKGNPDSGATIFVEIAGWYKKKTGV